MVMNQATTITLATFQCTADSRLAAALGGINAVLSMKLFP